MFRASDPLRKAGGRKPSPAWKNLHATVSVYATGKLQVAAASNKGEISE